MDSIHTRINENGAESLTQRQKRKSGCSLPKGIEHPLALLYNLITTKNHTQSNEVIIQQ